MKKNKSHSRFIRENALRILAGLTVVLSVAAIAILVRAYVLPRMHPGSATGTDPFTPTSVSPPRESSSDIPETSPETFTSTSVSATAMPDSTVSPTSVTSSAPSSEPSATTVQVSKPTPSPTPSGPVWYDGFVDPRTVEYEIVSNPGDITVLINKYYAVSEDYVPELAPAASSASQRLRPEANTAWDLMRAACLEDTGKTLYLTAGYSTFEQRIALFEGAIKKVNDGVSGFTMKRVVSKYAYAGRSEHNVGLALDIREFNDSAISSNFLNTPAGAWMSDHAHEYGFILRYPAGKGHITGYDFEAWHFRYVGVDLATTLYTTGQTLEEYYGKEQVLP